MDIDKKYITLLSKEDYERNKPFIICTYCDKIMLQPIQCKDCHQCYCSSCFDDLPNHKVNLFFSSIFTKKDTKCPHSHNEPCTKAQNYIANLCFKCKYSCNEIIKLADYKDHIEFKCSTLEYRPKVLDMAYKIDKLTQQNEKLENEILIMQKTYHQQIIDNSDWNIQRKGIQCELHEHLLEEKDHRYRNDWLCNKCRKDFKKIHKSFYCTPCDYDLCFECVIEKLFMS